MSKCTKKPNTKRRKRFVPPNKIHWTPGMIAFMRENHASMTRRELAAKFGLHLTVVRNKLYELGLFKLELEYFTDEQIAFLKANYKRVGDLELAEMFNAKWFKKKGWTKKHIEKKRRYLNLKRTDRQKFNILLRNCAQGRFDKCNWAGSLTRRRLRPGSVIVRTINGYKVKLVRVKGGFRKLAHINYEKSIGPIPPGKMIVMKDGNPLNCAPENLKAVSRSEHAESMRYTDRGIANYLSLKGKKGGGNYKDERLFNALLKRPDLLAAKRSQLQLHKYIKEAQYAG